ncbi:MAG: bifunctional riboflavin kinase/FAD synthetase [Marmoricola sp.]
MALLRWLTDPVPQGSPAVVTIGNFDGVHRGHQHVVERAGLIAEGRPVVAVTFEPHPMAVLRPEHAPQTLTALDRRARLLCEAGADAVVALQFDTAMASWTPEEFVERILVEALNAAVVVVGANFRFGNRAAGDVASLTAAGAVHGFTVDGVDLDGGPQVWSSTYVRTCLAAGDVEGAAEALGRPYAVVGPVMRGDQRGRELGYPTANVALAGQAAPADGVYAGWLQRHDTGETFPAAISVGTNPTFAGDRERRVEAYVIDRDDHELYDVVVEVSFVARLRGMVAFGGIDELLAAMADDVERARTLLGAI